MVSHDTCVSHAHKKRDSNFELLRIVAIYFVLVLHTDFFALDGPSPSDIVNSSVDSFLRIFFQAVSITCVDVFVMISGWFGIRPSRKGFLNLIFQISFYLTSVYLLLILLGKVSFSLEGVENLLLLTDSHWFVKAYICLYILAPVLNCFVENTSKRRYLCLLTAFFSFQTLYGWLSPSSTDYILGGYSPLSFVGLYLLARYVRIYKPKWMRLSPIWCSAGYFAIALGITLLCFLPPLCGFMERAVYAYMFMTYISPTTIFASLLMIILFSKLHFTNNVINILASSSFAVYLVYVSPWILYYYRCFFLYLHQWLPSCIYWGLTLFLLVVMYLVVVCFDQIRKFIYTIVCNSFCNENK